MPDINLIFGGGHASSEQVDDDWDFGHDASSTASVHDDEANIIDYDCDDGFRTEEEEEEEEEGLETDSTASSSSVVTIPDDEIPNYFTRFHGRLYPRRSVFESHIGPYSLPCDASEQERVNSQHELLKQIVDTVHLQVVQQALAGEPGVRKMALDVGTGPGRWVEDMALAYPHVRFIGMDLVPLATRYPRINEQFEIGDANAPLRWESASMHLIHARALSHGVSDWPRFLQEVSRVLIPGGLFLSVEWERTISSMNGLNGALVAPGAYAFFATVNTALWTYCSITSPAPQLPSYLRGASAFTAVEHRVVDVPISLCPETVARNPMSAVFGHDTLRYAQSITGLLLAVGMSEEFVGELILGLQRDLETVPSVSSPLHVLHARKVASW